MSSRTMLKMGGSNVGFTNDDREILVGGSSKYHEDILSFTPPSVSGNGDVVKCDFFLDQTNHKIIEQILWQLTVSNSSATDTVAFNSLLYFLEEFKLNLNNTLIFDLKDYEEIVNTVNHYYQKLRDDTRTRITWGMNNSSSVLNFGQITLAPATTTTYYVSLLPLLEMLYMKNSFNIPKITVLMKFKTNTNATIDNGRFVTNLTSNTNPYSLMTFSNMNMQINSRVFSSAVPYSVKNTVYPIYRYETNVQTLNLSSANQQWKILLSTAFSIVG